MKKITAFVILIPVFFLLLLEGCEKSLSPEEMKSRIIEANKEVNSYEFDVNYTQTSYLDSERNPLKIIISTEGHGKSDKKNKLFYIKTKSVSDMMEMKLDFDSETYVVGDDVYTKVFDVWGRRKASEKIWRDDDQIRKMVELIENSSLREMNDRRLQKDGFIIMRIKPDLRNLLEFMMKLQGDTSNKLMGQINKVDDIIDEFAMTAWINKKTYIIEKMMLNMKATITAKDVIGGANQKEKENSTLTLRLEYDLEFRNINEAVKIILPEEAKDAIEMPDIKNIIITDRKSGSADNIGIPRTGNTGGMSINQAFLEEAKT